MGEKLSFDFVEFYKIYSKHKINYKELLRIDKKIMIDFNLIKKHVSEINEILAKIVISNNDNGFIEHRINDVISRIEYIYQELDSLTLPSIPKDDLTLHINDWKSKLNLLKKDIKNDKKIYINCDKDLLEERLNLMNAYNIKNTFYETLEKIKNFYTSKDFASPNCFISYAWPIDNNEKWMQPFLKELRNDLKAAGIGAKLDIIDNKIGNNINAFAAQAENMDFVILVGTRSLLKKYETGLSIVCDESIHISRKRKNDTEARVLPIMLNGSESESFPPGFERFSTIRSWLNKNYIENVIELIRVIYRTSPDNKDFKSILSELYNLMKKKYLIKTNEKLTYFFEDKEIIVNHRDINADLQNNYLFNEINYKNIFSINKCFWGFNKFNNTNAFYEREKEIEYMIGNIKSANKKNRALLVCGIHGVGKSMLIRKIADEFMIHEEYTHFFWVNVNSELDAHNYLTEFVNEASVLLNKNYETTSDIRQLFGRLSQALSDIYSNANDKGKTKFIFFIDNAKNDNEKVINLFVEKLLKNESLMNKVTIVLTSNSNNWNDSYVIEELKSFSDEDSINYITKSLPESYKKGVIYNEEVNKLSKFFYNHPLSLFHAVAYIKAVGCTINTYFELIENNKYESDPKVIQPKTLNEPYAYKHFMLAMIESINEIKKRDSIAFRLLSICAYLNSYNIPISLLSSCFSENEKIDVWNAITLLREFSFLRKKDGNDITISMHDLVQNIILEFERKGKNFNSLIKLIKVLNDNLPRNIEFTTKKISILFEVDIREILHHARTIVENIIKFSNEKKIEKLKLDCVKLLEKISLFAFVGLGDYQFSVSELKKCISLIEPLYKNDKKYISQYYVRMLRFLMANYIYLGDFTNANSCFYNLIEVAKDNIALSHHVARAHCDMGYSYLNQGKYCDALNKFNIAYKLPGIDVTDFEEEGTFLTKGHCLEGLSLSFLGKGEYVNAAFYAEKTIDLFKGMNIENNPRLGEAKWCLGLACLFQWMENLNAAMFKEAESCFKECIEIFKNKWGDHPDLAEAKTWLGWAYYYYGNYEKAIMLAKEAELYYRKNINSGIYRKSIFTYILLTYCYECSDTDISLKYLEKANVERKLFSNESYAVSFLNGKLPIKNYKSIEINANTKVSYLNDALLGFINIYGEKNLEIAFHNFRLGLFFYQNKQYENAYRYFFKTKDIFNKSIEQGELKIDNTNCIYLRDKIDECMKLISPYQNENNIRVSKL